MALDVVEGRLRRTSIRPGRIHPLPVGLVHDVVAVSSTHATSIHVYSPPLVTMRRWDPVTLSPDEAERVAIEDPVIDGVAAGRVLHPSFSGSSVAHSGTHVPENAR